MHPVGRFAVAAVISTVLACVAMGATASSTTSDPSIGFAERAVALLVRADARGLATIHHYPEAYTAEERAKDLSDVAASLDFLLERFGKLETVRPVQKPVAFYEVGSGGGTVPYWASVSPIAERSFTYSVEFAQLGSGFVVLSVVRVNGGPPELRQVSFGLPSSSPTAKSTILDLMANLMQRMGAPVSGEIRNALANELQATVASPAKIE